VSEASAKDAALCAALLTKQSRLACWALIDVRCLWETSSKIEPEFVGRSLTTTEATLAAGIRAIGFAASRWELARASRAHTLVFRRRAIVT
jgi:hypothetical protein